MILLRGGEEALEVLLVKRTPKARFMGGVWVFPGGAVDAEEGDGDGAPPRRPRSASCARRRRSRSTDPASWSKFSRWITPAAVKIRFDTHFFLAPLPAGQEPAIDGEECVDLGWFTPQGALDAHARRGDPARVPHDQAPRAARASSRRVEELLALRARARGDAGRAAGRDRGRGRAHPAARRAGLLTIPSAAARPPHGRLALLRRRSRA